MIGSRQHGRPAVRSSGGLLVDVALKDLPYQLGYGDVLALGALSDLTMQVGGYTHLKPWRMGVAPGERLPAWDKAAGDLGTNRTVMTRSAAVSDAVIQLLAGQWSSVYALSKISASA